MEGLWGLQNSSLDTIVSNLAKVRYTAMIQNFGNFIGSSILFRNYRSAAIPGRSRKKIHDTYLSS